MQRDEHNMNARQGVNITQDAHEPYRLNIIMPTKSLTRAQAKRLKQTFYAYVQECINEK